jgi:hypothetical protein
MHDAIERRSLWNLQIKSKITKDKLTYVFLFMNERREKEEEAIGGRHLESNLSPEKQILLSSTT